MIKVAFLVEGDLEKLFLENACPNMPVRKVICNGIAVSSSAIVERIETHYKLLESKVDFVIALFDRERRAVSYEEFKKNISDELIKKGISNVIVGICDRKIENWMLADEIQFPEFKNSDPESLDGKGSILKVRGSYHETTDGIKILKACNPELIAKRSKSFKAFRDSIVFLHECWWFQEKDL